MYLAHCDLPRVQGFCFTLRRFLAVLLQTKFPREAEHTLEGGLIRGAEANVGGALASPATSYGEKQRWGVRE